MTRQAYDPYSPWKREAAESLTFSGVVWGKNLVLTLSAPLEQHVLIEVSKRGKPRRYPADVFSADYVSGVAVLRVKADGSSSTTSRMPSRTW